MLQGRRRFLLLALAIAVLTGCAANGSRGSPTGGAGFGEPCQKTEDCASGLCVQIDASGGICTRACAQSSGCPDSPNWGCVQPSNFSTKVCACVPDAATEICGDGIDNDCNGRVDDCQTCDGQQVSLDSHDNCGSCGHQCRPDQICSVGACRCPAGADECGGQCVDTQSSNTDCGSCGNACNAGQSCQVGACVCDDPTTPDYCPSSGCVDTSTDTQNCGSCGNTCQVGQDCIGGTCTCPGTESYCDGSGCVDLQTDVYDCGSCGNTCPSGATCFAGTCSCAVGTPDVCNSTCTNLQTDNFNCGTCGTVCSTGKNCVNGVCSCPYLTPDDCNGTCVNLMTSNANCGGCGNACLPSESCINGTCSCGNNTLCGTACVNTSSDANNCGTCGNVCPTGQSCSYGSCVCNTYGLTACGANCVDTSTDTSNCGTCGTVCPSNQVCASGTCQCPSGQSWCASANQCFDLNNDTNNCGSCGTVCNPGEVCSYGQCGCSTYTDKWCASANTCIDVYSDANNCGDCGAVCPAATHCSYASCVCDQAGLTLCGSSCADLQSDAAHCGSCGNACPGNMICSSGKCACPDPVVGTPIRLTTTSTDTVMAAAAWDGTHVGVVYLEGTMGAPMTQTHLFFALLNPDGTRAVTPDVELTKFASAAYGSVLHAPDIAWSGTEYGVVWPQYDSTGTTSSSDLMFRRVAANGTPQGSQVSITAGTPGTPFYVEAAQIGWSPTYGGYAIAGRNYYLVGLQLIGTDGTAPSAVNGVQYELLNEGLAVSPSGDWAIASMATGVLDLIPYNADGSRTQAVTHVSYDNLIGAVDVLHDGTTWLVAFADTTSVQIQRGDSSATPYTVASITSNNGVKLSLGSGSALDVAWTDQGEYRMRRLLLPSGTSNSLTPLSNEVTIVSTSSLAYPELVHTGSSSLLAIWSDNRWGAPELYAAPIDVGNCP